jgi:penicillin-binding protein 2
MANLAAIIANRGYYYIPHIIKSFASDRAIDTKYTTPQSVSVEEEHFKPVIDGMERVINSGTARRAAVPGISVCGKTGTSQNSGADHSVFFAFAPKDNPKIAIAVYVENAGGGSGTAAPIGGLMIEKYLNRKIATNRAYIETRIKDLNLTDLP